MSGKVEARHERILHALRERGTVRITELARILEVSEVTVRRDVTALEAVGRLRRMQGSVSWPTQPLSARDARLTRQATVPVPRGVSIGMVVPSGGYFYGAIVRAAQEAAVAAGARLRVAITEYRAERDVPQMIRLLNTGVDGLLLTPSWSVDGPSAEECAPFARASVPVVFVERQVPLGLPGAHFDRICSDHEAGAASAVEHLAGLGHDRIALLGRYSHTMPQLIRGYRAATHALGLAQYVFAAPAPVPLDHPDIYEPQADRFLEAVVDGQVRAVIVHTDTDAINLIPRLEERGLRVPEDVAMVSYDDELTVISDVALTAVAPAKQAIGRGAVNLLLRRMAEPKAGATRTELVPELVVRDSSGAALNRTSS